jgi:hypothetical protein
MRFGWWLTIEPRTEMGRFLRSVLRAGMVGEAPDPGRVLDMADDDPEATIMGVVLDSVVGLLVRRRFRPGTDVRELHRYVSAIQAGLEPDETLAVREAEAYLRARLGEPYLLTDVDPDRMGEPLGELLWQLAQDVPLTESDVDDLVVQAEGLAERMARGRRVSTGTWEVLAAGPDEGSTEIPRSWVVDWSAIPRPKVTRFGRADAPQTRPGHYIRALVLNDRANHEQLFAEMRGTPETSTTVAIMSLLGPNLLRAAFPLSVDLRRVTATMAYVRGGFRKTKLSGLPLLEMDAVARKDLGEEAFVEGIPLRVRHATRIMFVAAAVQEVPLAEREVDALVAAAERRVMEPEG